MIDRPTIGFGSKSNLDTRSLYFWAQPILNILRKQSDWGKEDCYACSYWQIGKADNERQSKVLDD